MSGDCGRGPEPAGQVGDSPHAVRPAVFAFCPLPLGVYDLDTSIRQRERTGDAAEALLARMEKHVQSRYLVQPVTEAVVEVG